MSAVQQAIESLGLDKRCRGFCRMCDLGLQDRFDSTGEGTRKSFVDALASNDWEESENPRALLGLVVLLNQTEFDQFIARLAQRAPFNGSLVWRIIRTSSINSSQWFIERGTAPFQRQFHLHPAIAPLLLQAAIRPASQSEDILALFEFFEPVAREYPVLREALPLWHAELERRALERKVREVREERENAERQLQEQKQAARLSECNAIQYRGPAAIISALADTPPSCPWDYPENWTWITDKKLRCVPQASLEQALQKISSHTDVRCWMSLAHKIRNALKSVKRFAELAELEHLPLTEKLRVACDSRWSLTYFPETWAEQIIREASSVSDELRTRLLSKLMRLQRRSPWRTVRQSFRPRA